ncbi:MAG: hypothetical protein MJE68_16265 [Proteobacteria bacterium]|nr:hypothetical protein [Pseudomonadota bacterium]
MKGSLWMQSLLLLLLQKEEEEEVEEGMEAVGALGAGALQTLTPIPPQR